MKQEQISIPIKESIEKYGNHSELLFMIIFKAMEALTRLIKQLIQKKEQLNNTVVDFENPSNKGQVNQTISVETSPIKTPAPAVTEKKVIPPRPRIFELAHEYEMRLEEIMDKLRRQNSAIHTKEVEKELIDEDLRKCTGLFRGKKRKELQVQLDRYEETIKVMKQGLSHIVQDYKYPTVDVFLQVYKQGKAEYEAYERASEEWESRYGEKSIHRKLAEKQAEVQKREQEKDHCRLPSSRGAR